MTTLSFGIGEKNMAIIAHKEQLDVVEFSW